MTRPRIGAEMARAAARQLQHGRSDISVLLGAHASTPGHFADEGAVRRQIETAIAGEDPGVTTTCLRHLGDLRTTETDVTLIRHAGVDPAVALYLLACLGEATVEWPGGRAMRITRSGSAADGISRGSNVNLNAPIGNHVDWFVIGSGHEVSIPRLPGAATISITERAETGRVPLRELLEHPVLDMLDIAVAGVRTGDGGSSLWLVPDGPLTWRPAADVITGTEGRSA